MSFVTFTPEPDADDPFTATVLGSSVIVSGVRNVAVAMTPEAVLDSLEPLRAAAEQAMRNRADGLSQDDGAPE